MENSINIPGVGFFWWRMDMKLKLTEFENKCCNTPLKSNGWNPKSPNWKGKSSSKPPFFGLHVWLSRVYIKSKHKDHYVTNPNQCIIKGKSLKMTSKILHQSPQIGSFFFHDPCIGIPEKTQNPHSSHGSWLKILSHGFMILETCGGGPKMVVPPNHPF